MSVHKRLRLSPEIPTSSMADIAFLLIIFFLVTTSMSTDKGLGLTLPPIGSSVRVPERNITKVWINSSGEIMHDQEMVTLEQMGERIKIMTETNTNLIVSIKTDPDARYDYFVRVVDEIKKAGNEKISIAEPDFGR